MGKPRKPRNPTKNAVVDVNDTQGEISREEFVRHVEEVVRTSFPGATFRPHPEAFGVLVRGAGGEGERALFLENLFFETRRASPADRRKRLENTVGKPPAPSASDLPWEEARTRVLPLLRRPSVVAVMDRQHPEQRLIRRPVAPFLIELVAVDSEAAITLVGSSALAAWGVEAPAVFEAATRNAAAQFRDDVRPFEEKERYPSWTVARDDSYQSSRLLVPGWLASFAGKVTGRPVAIVPSRNVVIVGGDGDHECIQRLAEIAKGEFESSSRSISPAVYTVDDHGALVPFVLMEAGHPVSRDVTIGHLMLAMVEYQFQEKLLRQADDEPAFIAPFKAFGGKDGRPFTVTTWTNTVPALLPKADRVVLDLSPENQRAQPFEAPWEAVMTLAGDCLQREADLDPPRWRTTGWPSDAVIAKLEELGAT